MNSAKAIAPKSKSFDRWCIDVSGYMQPYNLDAVWANDWLEAHLIIHSNRKKTCFPIKHLLFEELFAFRNWLRLIENDKPTCSYFEFTDSDIFFELIEENGDLSLKMIHGFSTENRKVIAIHIKSRPEMLARQIANLSKLISRFPCRCGLPH